MISSPLDEIKNRLDIVEVVGSYIKLQKTGANFRALCPFHSEKKPSFFVSPVRQIWHCFGCSKGGDIFGFVKEIERVEFGDALRILAQKAGVELKPRTPEFVKWQTERQRLYEICELATKFFEKQLEESSVGKEVKKYLLQREINEESIKKWRLGYGPDSWQGLLEFLISKGYSESEVIKAGLSVKREEGSNFQSSISPPDFACDLPASARHWQAGRTRWRAGNFQSYDRFRGRIIFPIFDLNSQVVGFGGRVFKEKDKAEIAKYVNTPNTLLYDKSRILYGLDRAKVEIRKKDVCILVEGYTDVIMAHQVGTQNVVATSGTALTPYQLKAIKRYSENLILGFDMDVAGDSATKRGIDLAQSLGFNIKVIRLPEGKGGSRSESSLPPKDAADIISEDPKKWLEALENPKSILEFYFQSAFSNKDQKTPEGKKEISKILLPVLKRIPNQIERAFWIQKLARELEVKEENIEEELKKVKLPPTTFGAEVIEEGSSDIKSGGGPSKSRMELLEERLLTLILKFPQQINLIGEKEFLTNLKNKAANNEEYFNYLSLKAEIEEVEEKEILPEIQFCLREIRSLEIKSRLDQISKDLKKAESEKDFPKIEKLTQEFNQLAKNII